MNRREFITGAASLSLVGWRGIARAAGYPDYWAANLAPRTVRTGEEVRFEARHLRGDLTWGCYDADSVTNIPNPANRWMRLAQYHNTLATITPGGVLAPRKAGEIVVLAMDANFNKEIFPVTIG